MPEPSQARPTAAHSAQHSAACMRVKLELFWLVGQMWLVGQSVGDLESETDFNIQEVAITMILR